MNIACLHHRIQILLQIHYLKHDGCCWPWPQALTASVKWHGSSAASWWSCTPTWTPCIRICWSTLPLIQRRPPWRSYSLISATSEPCSWWVKNSCRMCKVSKSRPRAVCHSHLRWELLNDMCDCHTGCLSSPLHHTSVDMEPPERLMISYSAGCHIQARKQNKACSSL